MYLVKKDNDDPDKGKAPTEEVMMRGVKNRKKKYKNVLLIASPKTNHVLIVKNDKNFFCDTFLFFNLYSIFKKCLL